MRKICTGVRYVIEGGAEKEFEEVGVPNGTTMIVRNLFYNTLPRKKFLKQPQTEGSYVVELMEHLALSHPQIAFNFIINNQNRFHTSGSNDLKEIIYRIYGKDIVKELNEIHVEREGFSIDGFLGKPIINRSNRNYELFYINGRYIKSSILSKAIEDGYKEYLMQHKFPFCVLHFNIDTRRIDVNVHPAKMEVKIAGEQEFYELVRDIIFDFLHKQEMIPEVTFKNNEVKNDSLKNEAMSHKATAAPEPFEAVRIEKERLKAGIDIDTGLVREPVNYMNKDNAMETIRSNKNGNERLHESEHTHRSTFKSEQLELFDDKLLSVKAREHYEIIGQIFDTYWLVSYQDKLMIIDQHAAHEKVKYERLIKQFNEKSIVSQSLNPPAVITLNGREKACLIQNMEHFEALGFVIEEFGGNDYALVSVPMDLYGYRETELLYELLDELSDENVSGTPESIRIKIATMACKAAVKGNMRISKAEMEALIDELLSLDNPYNCPHGRPTIISMSKYELEKKFKRIVTI
ncbi:MAG: DNA mismatch repair endonuclease MutL [Lachnospiraceae bacterium]|nr:DNA mismatch repair endonuclease MutL [Lachnospiraceae bacterium]